MGEYSYFEFITNFQRKLGYEKIKNDDITEKKYISELLELFEKLTLIGFEVAKPDMFEDENYGILITRSRKKRFYIRDQINGNVYYSKKYEQQV